MERRKSLSSWMGWCEDLEPRRLLSAGFAVTFADPGNTYASYESEIGSTLMAAGNEWASHLDGSGTIDIQVTFNPFVSTAQTRSTSMVTVGTDAMGIKIDEQAAAYEVATGIDPNGSAQDVELTLGTRYLTNDLWFDPNPTARATLSATPVPADKIDAYSVFLHELGHAFAFNGNRDQNGTLDAGFGDEESTFDAGEISDGANLFFSGPHALAAHGGQPVALTRDDAFHVGNATGDGTDVASDLMNGVAFVRGQRYFLSDLDLAIAADCDVPVKGLAPVLSVTGGKMAEGAPGATSRLDFTVSLSQPADSNVTFSYATADGTAHAGSDYAATSGSLTIPAGQTSAVIPVNIFGDSQVEPDESFSLAITAVSGAVVDTPAATGTIVNDDSADPVRTLVVTSKKKATYLDANHQTVTVSLKGPGSATLTFTSASAVDADTLTLAGTTAKTSLTLSSKKATTLRQLDAGGALASISAKNVSLVNGSLAATLSKSLSLKTVVGSTVTLGGAGGSLAVTVAGVQGATFTANYLKSVKSTAWTSSTLAVNGLGSLSTSTFAASTLRSGGSVGSISATSVTGSTLFAAVGAGVTTLPVDLSNFTSVTATIKSFTVKKAFSDTLVAAPVLASVKLPRVSVTDPSRAFGVAGNTITALSASTPARKKLSLKKLTAPAQSYSEGDLLIRVL